MYKAILYFIFDIWYLQANININTNAFICVHFHFILVHAVTSVPDVVIYKYVV
jgi:hypothetical protein